MDNFIDIFGFDPLLPESDKFEYFSIFSILSQKINNSLNKNDLEIFSTGKSKGVDAIAVAINEKTIFSSDELDSFDNQSLIVDFYFFQSKTSSNFSDSELGNFLDVVIDFFQDNPQYNIAEFNEYREIYKKIKESFGKIRGINLNCLYTTLGPEQEKNTSINSTIEIKRKLLILLNILIGNSMEILN